MQWFIILRGHERYTQYVWWIPAPCFKDVAKPRRTCNCDEPTLRYLSAKNWTVGMWRWISWHVCLPKPGLLLQWLLDPKSILLLGCCIYYEASGFLRTTGFHNLWKGFEKIVSKEDQKAFFCCSPIKTRLKVFCIWGGSVLGRRYHIMKPVRDENCKEILIVTAWNIAFVSLGGDVPKGVSR